MNFKKTLAILLIYLLIINQLSLSIFSQTSANNTEIQNTSVIKTSSYSWTTNIDYATDRLIVKFKSWHTPSLSTFQSILPWESLTKIEYLNNLWIWFINFRNGIKNINKTVQSISKDSNIEYVELDYKREIQSYTWVSTNDTYSNNLWYLKSIWADKAWQFYNDNENKTIVSVNDTGIDYSNNDLSPVLKDLSTNCKDDLGNLILWWCQNHWWNFEWNWAYNSTQAVLPENEIFDLNWHWTHVTWIIWAKWNNWSWTIWVTQNASIFWSRVESFSREIWIFYVSNVIRALNFAIQNWAKVVNASYWWTTYSQAEYDSINIAKTNGVLVIAASWNSSNNNDWTTKFYPASYDLDNILSVAAVWANDTLSSYSNYWATTVDVAAPGWDIWIQDSWIFSTYSTWTTIYYHDTNSFSWITLTWTWLAWNIYKWVAIETQSWAYDWATSYTWSEDKSLIFNNTFNLAWAKFAKFKWFIECDLSTWDNFDILINNQVIWSAWANWTYYRNVAYSYSDIEIPIPQNLYTSWSQLKIKFHSNSDSNNGYWCLVNNVSIIRYDNNKNTYKYLQWTSMATPVVTWLAAMLWSYKPDLTYTQVKDLILSSIDSIPWLSWKVLSWWKINAHNAITNLISNYWLTKNWSFDNRIFITKFIDLKWKNISLSWSLLFVDTLWSYLSLSWSSITWTWEIFAKSWIDFFNNSNKFLWTSNDFNIILKNSSWVTLSSSWENLSWENLILDYVWNYTWSWLIVDLVSTNQPYFIYKWPLQHNLNIPITKSFTWVVQANLYKKWDLINNIGTWVTLNLYLENVINSINYTYLPSTITWSLTFASGSYTNNTTTSLSITSNFYPVDYELSWDIVWTYTWTLNNSWSILVNLSSWDWIKNVSLVLKNWAKISDTISKNIWLDRQKPTIQILSHTNNQVVNTSTITLTWEVYDCDQISDLLWLCIYWWIANVKVNWELATLSWTTFSKQLNLNLWDNNINYISTDNAWNNFTWSISISRVSDWLTWNLNFASWSYTNSWTSLLNITSNVYPINYQLSWDINWTYTWTLNNSWSILVNLSSWEWVKNISVTLSWTWYIQKTYSWSIILDQTAPSINILSHLNNQKINSSSIYLTGTVYDLNWTGNFKIDWLNVTLSWYNFSKNLTLDWWNNIYNYIATDFAWNTSSWSINLIRIANTSNIYSDITGSWSVNITFQTDITSTWEVLYGTWGTNLNNSILGVSTTSHSIDISGLNSDTQYFFKVKWNNNWYTWTLSDLFSFKTPSSLDIDSFTWSKTNTWSVAFSWNKATLTWVIFSSTWSLSIKSQTWSNLVTLTLSWLIIHSNNWNLIFNPPSTSSFSWTFSKSWYNHVPWLTFKIWNDYSELSLSGSKAEVQLYIWTSYNWKTIWVFRSINNWWSYDFLSKCSISNWICTFYTDKFSLFTLATENTTSYSSSSSSSSSSWWWSSWGGSSSWGSSSGWWSSSWGAFIAPVKVWTCQDIDLECKETSAWSKIYKLYKKDWATCEWGKLSTTCEIEKKEEILLVKKQEPVKYLDNWYKFKSKVIEKIFNKKKIELISIDEDLSEIIYLWKDVENYRENYRYIYSKFLESTYKIDELLIQDNKNIESVKKEYISFLSLYNKLKTYNYNWKINYVIVWWDKVLYLKYDSSKINEIHNILLKKLSTKETNTYVYRLANIIVHNLNKLLTDKSLNKSDIEQIRKDTIDKYKEFVIQLKQLKNK